MSCRLVVRLIIALTFYAATVPVSAVASTNSGIDTPGGVTTLPLAVEGVEGMTLSIQNPPTGPVYVGIGMPNPTVALDIAGGMRPGSTTEVTACGAGQANGEGTQRYNYTTHLMEYCNGTAWEPLGVPASRTWHSVSCSGTNSYSYPIDVAIETQNSGVSYASLNVGGTIFQDSSQYNGLRNVIATVPPGVAYSGSGYGVIDGCYALY